jgi:signal transduction histidine kinase
MLPVLVAVAGIVVLSAMHISDAVAEARQADRATTLAGAMGTIATLAHEVGLEFVASEHAARQPPSRTREQQAEANRLWAEQRARTDAAVLAFAETGRGLREAGPDLGPLADAAERSLAARSLARAIAEQNPDGTAEVFAYYDDMMSSLLVLADAMPAQMNDKRLIELTRSVAITTELHRLAALQLDLVARGLVYRELSSRDLLTLARWVGAEENQVESLNNLEPAVTFYDDISVQPWQDITTGVRLAVLDSRGLRDSLLVPSTYWTDAQSLRLAALRDMGDRLAAELNLRATELGTAARNRTAVTAALTSATIIATLIGAALLAIRISRRLRRTRQAALIAARHELPHAISNVIAAPNAEVVRSTLTESSTRIDGILPTGPDEVGELATAFGAVHRQALRLAADQALLRMEVQAMFIALSRRGQTLIQRQIHLIDEFGRNEVDPEALSRLFALDHLAARMRRNEENLLVLAGGEPGRWITRPVAVADLLRAAAQEIEEYQRIQITDAPSVATTAHIAGDAIHLLAELFENATAFSPPHTKVRVSAFRRPEGLLITVVDTGIGMPAGRVAEANERLARPSALTSTLVGTMGLLVVARLAQRHGIRVHLDSVPAGGTTASVMLPDRAVVPITSTDLLQPARRLPPDAARPVPAPAATSMPPSLAAPPVSRPALSGPPAPGRSMSGPPVSGPPISGPPVSGPPLAGRPVSGPPVPGRPVSGPPGSGLPVIPGQRPAPSPAPAAASAPMQIEVEFTDAGLPRRSPDPTPPLVDDSGLPQGMPDPETVRARLSSLASGIAAANRDTAPPPSAPPPTR